MYRYVFICVTISRLFVDSDGCSSKRDPCESNLCTGINAACRETKGKAECYCPVGTTGDPLIHCETLEFVDYDLNEISSGDNEWDGGVFADDKKDTNDKLPCQPSITLCSKEVNGPPVCKKGRAWIRQNFNKDAESWRIRTPFKTSQDKRNCFFEIFEYPRYSKQGHYKLIEPGTDVEIFWNIRSLRHTK